VVAHVEGLQRRTGTGNGDGAGTLRAAHVAEPGDRLDPATERLALGLGWFSFALGVPQVLAPGAVCRLVGVNSTARNRWIMRSVGVRELAAWYGIVRRRRKAPWLWGRVAGDMKDLALLSAAMTDGDNKRGRVAGALTSVAGVTVLDLVASVRASRATGPGEGGAMHAKAAVTVKRPTDEVYRFWHDFENLSRFMTHVESVRPTGNGRYHWVASTPLLPKKLEWDAQIVEDVPDRSISWRSTDDTDIPNSGSVRFMPAPGGRGTEVTVELDFRVPGGALAEMVAKVFGEEPVLEITDDLRRFKQVMETGEIIRSEGSPDGTRPHVKQRPAQPLP
jgi:uncharacterized membrane protein